MIFITEEYDLGQLENIKIVTFRCLSLRTAESTIDSKY